MRYFFPLFLGLLVGTAGACVRAQITINNFDPAKFLGQNIEKSQVLLVGSFHFNYPNLDAHKVGEADQVDVKSRQKQAEMRELLDYLARFRPTKIVVECRDGSTVNQRYRNYLAGQHELGKNEIEQLGFRLAERFGHDSLVYGDDLPLSSYLLSHRDSAVLHPLVDSLFSTLDADYDSTLSKRYFELYQREVELMKTAKLLDVFKYKNTVERTRLGHGHYLELESEEAADALSIWWYNRNLRIYRRIMKATAPGERVLVLFGSGHLGILRQQFESSPRFELVDFADL